MIGVLEIIAHGRFHVCFKLAIESKSIEDVIKFHQKFESIHLFQDENGRVGRLVMFKECLANNIVPL